LKPEQLRQSNEEKFNRMVIENHQKIYSMFRRMVPSHDEADDLTQETFIKVYKNLSKFRNESSAYTWIYRIAVNTGLNYLRRQKIRQTVGLEKINVPAENNHSHSGEFQNVYLENAIKKLPSKQQMVIILRSYQGLTFREIGKIMDSTENAAKVNYAHALKNLKRIFDDMGVSYETV